MAWASLAPCRALRGDERMNHVAVNIRDIQFRFDEKLMQELGWQVGDRVDVMPGDGEHKGMVRIERNERGWRLHPPGGKNKVKGGAVKIAKSLAIAHLRGFPERLKPHSVDPRVVNGGVEILLPWATPPEDGAQAVARGREVKNVPPSMPGTFGNPVREQAHPYSRGRVR